MTTPLAVAVVLMATTAFAVPPFFDGFEGGVAQPSTSSFTPVASGTGGITSASGSYHAQVINGSSFSTMNGYDGNWNGGYVASIDVYFDMSSTQITDTGFGFDLTQALCQFNGFVTAHVVDMVMVVGADTATDSILIGASQNVNGVGTGIGSGSAAFFRGGGGALEAPKEFFTTGWYTLEWDLHENGGYVEASLNVIDPSSTVTNIHTWLVSGWTGSSSQPISTSPSGWHTGTTNTVGGNRYLWFANGRGSIAADNITLSAQTVEAVPLPAAAWAGMGLLGLIGAGRTIRRRRAA